MQPKFLISRFLSRTIAGAIFAALVGFGAAPAVADAQPVLELVKEGKIVGNKVQFTITLRNLGGASASNVEGFDKFLPGAGVLDWEFKPGAPNTLACGFQGTDFPDPEELYCDPGTVFPFVEGPPGPGVPGPVYSTVVEATIPSDITCLTLENTFLVTADDHDDVTDVSSIEVGNCEGRMTGGGSIFTKGRNRKGAITSIRVTHGFELRCDAFDPRQNLQINWPNPDGNQNNFHLTRLTSATCLDDPSLDQRPPRSAGFDTYIGEGEGRCNGLPATISFIFTDAGEPGSKDTAEYHISGTCKLDTTEQNITKGNQQTHSN